MKYAIKTTLTCNIVDGALVEESVGVIATFNLDGRDRRYVMNTAGVIRLAYACSIVPTDVLIIEDVHLAILDIRAY
jgi:hypothetical protein